SLSIDITGFEAPEVDALLGDLVDPEQDPADELPPSAEIPVSQSGDLWQLNEHRLLCGDATAAADLRRLMERQSAAMVFTDPPYNLRISSVQGRGRIKHGDFAQAYGEMSPDQFTRFLRTSLGLAAKHSNSGSIHYIFIDWRHIGELLAAGSKVYS